jgi:hypothetical protein
LLEKIIMTTTDRTSTAGTATFSTAGSNSASGAGLPDGSATDKDNFEGALSGASSKGGNPFEKALGGLSKELFRDVNKSLDREHEGATGKSNSPLPDKDSNPSHAQSGGSSSPGVSITVESPPEELP